MTALVPTMIGWRAVVLHRRDEGTDRLVRQLGLLGIVAEVQWQPYDPEATPADVLFVDADQGWPGLLPWSDGRSPMPVVALLQSEAPGRMVWAIEEGASAIVGKPVVASAVYPALILAVNAHRARLEAAARIERLEERVRMRPLVHAAVRMLRDALSMDEDCAYGALRSAAMKRRITVEQAAGEFLAGIIPLSEAG